ncbi:hypothetical protein E4U61_004118 [Claviceps capensis]|nr:hypothetical protein E4U61_004118 [Claviceps capensis]
MVLPHRTWNFNIDRYLNPFVPSVPAMEVRSIPASMVSGLSAQQQSWSSTPSNAICGQIISAFTGIAMAKLFQLSDRFTDIQWVGGALACASATALMALTKTVHSPAGATALLAVVDANLVNIGWFLLPVVLLGCVLMLVMALLVNNIERWFPIYWWTPEECRRSFSILRRRSSDELRKTASMLDEEKGGSSPDLHTAGAKAEAEAEATSQSRSPSHEGAGGSSDEATVGAGRTTNFTRAHLHVGEIVIRREVAIVPQHMFLTQEEENLLKTMRCRL